MILWAFLLFFGLSLILMFLGLWTQEQELQVLAFCFLFVPAWALLGFDVPLINDNAGIQYKTGLNTTTNYTYTNTTLTSTAETQTQITTTYNNRSFGLLLLIAAFGGFFVSLTDLRKARLSEEGPKSWMRWR